MIGAMTMRRRRPPPDLVELQPYEEAPYRRAIEAAYLAVADLETQIGRAPLPQDAAEIAVGAAVRRLVEDGQLPPLGTRTAPASGTAPPSHRRAPAQFTPSLDALMRETPDSALAPADWPDIPPPSPRSDLPRFSG